MGFRSFVLKLLVVWVGVSTPLVASEFTVASYNCGALTDHYDYIRAVCMHKLMQERYNEEPAEMEKFERVQREAARVFLGEENEPWLEWNEKEYDDYLKKVTAHPLEVSSPNQKWHELCEKMVTSYRERPVILHDKEVEEMLEEHVRDLTGESISNGSIDRARRVMAKRIFKHELPYDLIALQEADYLDATVFPEGYDVLFANTDHSVNGFAWKKERFALLEKVGDVKGRGFLALFEDLETGKRVLAASGHLSGCDPFRVVEGDSARGDLELKAILDLMEEKQADIKILAMDSNVTATHPRLSLLKEKGFHLDCERALEPTCSNPWQVLNTRIDWIAVQSADVTNIPVMGVHLNSPQTNISDHKPIASRIVLN